MVKIYAYLKIALFCQFIPKLDFLEKSPYVYLTPYDYYFLEDFPNPTIIPTHAIIR